MPSTYRLAFRSALVATTATLSIIAGWGAAGSVSAQTVQPGGVAANCVQNLDLVQGDPNLAYNQIACGASSDATGRGGTAYGVLAKATAESSSAVGAGAQATGQYSTAIGQFSHATTDFSTAVGSGSEASGDQSTALGYRAKATATGSVALGQGSVADQINTVSVGNENIQRRITNVADGFGQYDAVNMYQLGQRTTQALTDAKAYADTQDAATLAAANTAAAAGDATTLAAARDYTDQGVQAVAAFAAQGDANTLASARSYTDTRAAQTLTAAQAYTDQQVTILGQQFNARFDHLDDRIAQQGAVQAALSGLHPNPRAKGDNSLAVAVGGYRGEGALAIGYFRNVGDSTMISIGVSTNSGGTSGNLGASFSW